MTEAAFELPVMPLGPLIRAAEAAVASDTWIYFIQAGGDLGPIKIGITRNPANRLRAMRPNNAESLRLLAVHPGFAVEERMLQARFAAHRVRGEWFLPDPAIISWCAAFAPYYEADRRDFESRAGRP